MSTLLSLTRNFARRYFGSDLIKLSGDGDNEVPFEQALSSLAHAYIKDKAPSLFQYEVGFQLIDKDDEGSKACGVLGFKCGPLWLYVPIIYNMGKIDGHDILYLKNQDLVVPLKENWLNYLLQRRPDNLGTPITRNISQLGIMPPNIYQIKYPPSKYASDITPGVCPECNGVTPADESDDDKREGKACPTCGNDISQQGNDLFDELEQAGHKVASWARGYVRAYARIVTGNPLGDGPLLDLPSFLKEAGAPANRLFQAWCNDYPEIEAAARSFHGDALFAEVEKNAAAKPASVMDAFTAPAPKPPQSVLPDVEDPEDAGDDEEDDNDKVAGVTVISLRMARMGGLHPKLEVSDGDKEKLLKGEVVIKDERDDSEVTHAYDVDESARLQNPGDIPGLYDVLVRPGEFAECYVCPAPYARKGRLDPVLLVVRLSDKSWCLTNATTVWARPHEGRREDFEKFVDGLPTADKADFSRENLSVILSPSGHQATAPFRKTGDDGAGSYRRIGVCYDERVDKWRPLSLVQDYHHQESEPLARHRDYLSAHGASIIITGQPGRGFVFRTGHELYVPKGCKVLKLKDGKKTPALLLGEAPELHLMLRSAGKPLEVKKASSGEYRLGDKSLRKEDAVIFLTERKGLREKVAREILARADKDGRVSLVLRRGLHQKKAAGPAYDLQQQGFSTPDFPEPPLTSDPLTRGTVPSEESAEWRRPVEGLQANLTDRSQYDPNLVAPLHDMQAPDSRALQLAGQAAQSGQKEIFDTSMIGGLLKSMRTDSVVGRHLGGLLQSTSRLGKLLLHLYGNKEQWEERYGKDETPVIEDQLRDNFEGLGDLVLNLRQKEVNPDMTEGVLPDLQGTQHDFM